MIVVLHPGAMGAAVGACLVGAGHEVGWVSAGRSSATVDRAAAAGLTSFDSLAAALADADVVLSICPPHGALEVATAVADAGFAGTYVDANAVSPTLSTTIGRVVTAAGARYVDGGIIGGPPAPDDAPATRLYLAGDDGTVAALFAGTALEIVDLGGAPPAASALKMTYAAWTKGTSALLVSARRTAEALGVDTDLSAEWTRSQPQLPEQWARASEAAAEKGWRWAFELAEVGRTFASAGQPSGFGAAASEVFATAGAPAADPLDPRALDPRALGMAPHPEGGWFRETYRATTTVETPHGTRATATTVAFLLEPGQRSAWHRVRSDELWLWQGGGPVRLTLGGSGDRPEPGESVDLGVGGQHLVPGGVWQTAEPADATTLVACVVTPGFDFDDFELAD